MDEKMLSEQQVWDVLQFAQSASKGLNYGMGVYTPSMLNNVLVELNNNPSSATPQKVAKALGNYKSSDKELQAMNEFMEYTDMLFKRTINYYANLLSFDLSVSCKNAYTTKDYKSKEYEQDKRIVHKFLNKFDYRKEFKKMTKEMLRRETVFTWYREDIDGATLQTMPQKYCILTGYFPQGLLYNFDMAYFLQAGVNIDNYAPVFKDYYNEVFNSTNTENYVQSMDLKGMDNTFATTTETSPYEGAWAFKFDDSNFNGVPFLSAMMQDATLNSTIRALQKDKRMLEAYMLILGEMPLLNDSKVQKPDMFSVNPDTMGALLSIVRSSIDEHFKIGAVPATEMESYVYEDKNQDVYDKQLNTVASMSAGAGRILYSTDRTNQEELRQSLMMDYQLMKNLYSQFNNFLDFFINKKTRKYKFSFNFDGSTLGFERKEKQDSVFKLAENGIVLASAIQSAFGFTPMEFDAMRMESEALGIRLESIHTASGKESSGESGRPQTDNALTESGEKTRNSK